MTAKAHAAVWLDHHEARVFHVDLTGFDEKTLLAPAHQFRHEGRAAAEDEARFFETIAAALESAEEILVFGPSTAKKQFANWVGEHAPVVAKRITHVEASDHPTEGQFVAEVRKHFRIPTPRVHWPKHLDGGARDTYVVSTMKPLQAGTPAPDFTLQSTPDQNVTLSQLRGRPVVLVFYPADWSPVCGDQLGLYSELAEEFAKHDALLVGISVDGIWCHLAFEKDRKFRGITLLADFEPKGAVARTYGVYREKDGVTERALFVLDREGTIRWSYVSPVGINPGADGILGALESLEGAHAR